jgi:hypothetical protein
LFFHDFKITFNRNLVRGNYSLFNDRIHPFLINVTFENLAVVSKMWVYLKIRAPESDDDKSYQKIFLNTVVDLDKVLKGMQKNFIVSKIFECIFDASQNQLRLPLKKVREREKFYNSLF